MDNQQLIKYLEEQIAFCEGMIRKAHREKSHVKIIEYEAMKRAFVQVLSWVKTIVLPAPKPPVVIGGDVVDKDAPLIVWCTCSHCGKEFTWSKASSYYGSMRNLCHFFQGRL